MKAAITLEAINLDFEDLFYTPGNRGSKTKSVLNGVSGRFRTGRLTAILGPSGAGKTTLLNVLSGFKTQFVQGSITVNGRPRNLHQFRKLSCYITQEFAMLGLLTVLETLEIAASFKLSRQITQLQRSSVIKEIASILGLCRVMETQVRHLSGGEKKRLSIGVELITNPPIMFFDEPTSGLDSASSLHVITHLKTLAERGHTVVCVVHQPSSRMFEAVDDLYLMSGGQCLYNGPSTELVSSMAKAGFICPQYYNRADFAIEIACREQCDTEVLIGLASERHQLRIGAFYEEKAHIEDFCSDHELLKNRSEMVIVPVHSDSHKQKQHMHQPVERRQHYPISSLAQFIVLFRRCSLCMYRDLHLSQLRVGMHIVVAILLGLLYYDFGNDADKIVSNFSFIFFNVLFLFFGTCMPTVLTFPIETGVFIREHSNNWYSLRVYYLAKVFADLPLQILCPTLFLSIGYYLTSQPLEWSRFSTFWLVCILVSTLAQSFGNVAGAAFDVQLAVFIVPSTAIPLFLLSGYFLQPKDLRTPFSELSYLSFFKFAFEAAIESVLGFGRSQLPCSKPYCHYRNPAKFVRDIGMDKANYVHNVAALATWVVVMQVILYSVLIWKLRTSR